MPQDRPLPPAADRGIRIRMARPSDLGDLVSLETAAFSTDRLSRRRIRAFLNSPTAIVLIARRAKAAVGYALLLSRRDSRAMRLYSIAVAPGSTGEGIGSLLLAAAEDAARAHGAVSMRLEVRSDNAGAIRFYERRGYRREGRREGYYQDGMSALRYARPLTPSVRLGGTADELSRAA